LPLIDDTRFLEVYPFKFVVIFSHLIGVEGGDSSGKSVSRCDPAVSVANEEAHGPPAESVRPYRKSTESRFLECSYLHAILLIMKLPHLNKLTMLLLSKCIFPLKI